MTLLAMRRTGSGQGMQRIIAVASSGSEYLAQQNRWLKR